MKTYRMISDYPPYHEKAEEWRGRARNVEQAEEKCFFDEPPASFARYSLQVWTGKRWHSIYTQASL